MPKLWVVKIRRGSSAVLSAGALLIPLIVATLTIVFRQIQPQNAQESQDTLSILFHSWVFISSVFVAFVILAFKSYFNYRKLTYDPTWGIQFQVRFDEQMKQRRSEAAQALKDNREKLDDVKSNRDELSYIERVLDFLDDLGFYVLGDQVSPEVAHHYFYHWVRGYWITAQEYIRAMRRDTPRAYEHIEPLFDVLLEVEMDGDEKKKAQEESMSIAEQTEFLDDEISEWDGLTHS